MFCEKVYIKIIKSHDKLKYNYTGEVLWDFVVHCMTLYDTA